MLTLFTGGKARDCEGHSRREFLRVGTMGLGGLTLPTLLAANSQAGVGKNPVRGKSVVVLFLQGGPTHIETFDPKMTAPKEYRAMFGEVKTSVPGVTFGSHFEKLAALADKMAIVRSKPRWALFTDVPREQRTPRPEFPATSSSPRPLSAKSIRILEGTPNGSQALARCHPRTRCSIRPVADRS